MATFKIHRRTLGDELRANQMELEINAAQDNDAKTWPGMLIQFTRIMACTDDILFTKKELKEKPVQEFNTFWRNRNKRNAIELWRDYVNGLDYSINNLWFGVYDQVNAPLIGLDEKAGELLTKEEKELLSDDENFTP